MKKLLVIIAILMLGSVIYGQDVLQQFMYIDDYNLIVPLYMPDGITPIPDGTKFQVVIGDTYDDANPYALNNNFYEDEFNGEFYEIGAGFFLTVAYFKWEDPLGSPPEPVANCGEYVYLEIVLECGTWDPLLKWIRHSDFILGPDVGSPATEYETTWLAWEQEPCAVTLTSFQASLQGEFAAITWITASESDLRNFNLYRDGVLIHQEDATNSSETQTYTFIDEEVENHTTYNYVLEAVNLDGTTSTIGSTTLTIEIEEQEEIESTVFENVYPNPARIGATQHIKFAVKTGETATLTIYNAKGQVVETMDFDGGEHNFEFTPKFASGIYFYKLEGNNYSAVKKMLILK